MASIEVPVLEKTILPKTLQLDHDFSTKRLLVILQNDRLGHVEPPEGVTLLAGLLSQFVAMEALPVAVILQGAAVRLTGGDSAVAQQLTQLAALHVPVLICRESLEKLGMKNHLVGSRLASQREIAEHMLKASQIAWL